MPAAPGPDRRPGGPPSGGRRLRPLVAVALALVASVALQWRSRDLGRRDNGDWKRYSLSFATVPVGFAAPGEAGAPRYRPDRELAWHPLWRRKSPLLPPFSRLDTGSSWLLWLPGWGLNAAILEPGFLDLRLLGLPSRILVTAFSALLALTLSLRAPPGRRWDFAVVAASVALAAVQTDAGVISYANTFFRETAAQVFALALLCLLALPGEAVSRWRWGAAAALALAMTSAPIHALLLLPFLALLPGWERPVRRRLAVASLAAAVAAIGFLSLAAVPELRRNAAFNAFFYGIVRESSDPEVQVARAGLPAASASLVGKRSFDPASRDLLELREGPDHFDVARAAVTEPGALARLLIEGARALGPGAGPPGARAEGGGRSAVAALDAPWWRIHRVLAASGGLPWLLLASVGTLGIWSLARRPGGWEGSLAGLATFAALGAAVELGGNLLGDGYSGVSRHLFLARILFDEALVFGLMLVLCRTFPRSTAGAGT